MNLQNNHVYAQCGTKNHIAIDHLLCTRPMFNKSVMVSVMVSKLWYTELIFVEPGVKVDGAYYRDVPQSSICARLHLNSYYLTYSRQTALTLTRSIIRFGAVFRNSPCTRSPYVTQISWKTSGRDVVWRAAASCLFGNWWMEAETQGLCPCEVTSFWTSALIFLLDLFI